MIQIFRWLKKEAYWLPLSAVSAIIAVILAGFAPDPYLEHVRQIPPPHPYPAESVTLVIGFIMLHMVLLHFLLKQKSLMRIGFSMIVSVGFLALAVIGSMHASPPWQVYIILVFLIFIAVSFGFLVMLYQRCRSLFLKYKK